MSRSLAFNIAQRFRKARKGTGLISLVSTISTFSIALGVAALIIGLSAMNGFEKELQRRVLSVIPHGEIYQRNQPLQNWQNIQNQLNKQDVVKETAPYVSFTGIIEVGSKLEAALVKGINVDDYSQSARLKDFTEKGSWDKFKAEEQQLIIGKGLAHALSVDVGDWVTLLIPQLSQGNDESVITQIQAPKRVRVQIAAILNLSGELGSKMALMPLADAQKQLALGDAVTGIMVNVSDIYQANSLLYRAASSLNTLVYIKSWEYEYGYMYRDIQLIRSIMYLAMIVVIGIACFSIVSTLIVAVKDKSNDIAILKTQGASNTLIRRIFVYYGFIAGITGSLVGVILGVLVSLNLSSIMRLIEYISGRHILSGDVYFIDFIPSQLRISDVLIVLATALILSLIASVYPSRRASKIDPVKILKGNA